MSDTITTKARAAAIQAAADAAAEAVKSGQGQSRAIKWKAGELILPVATVDLDLVLLNPNSHRIGAQLRSLEADKRKTVTDDPYSPEAQKMIAALLGETPGFDRIKNALAPGQREPGIITSGGVLINANTRAVALRQLRRRYINVLVLPSDAGDREITDLELQLQMELDVKQDYTLTSQLLFIEELINRGRSTLEVGRSLRPDLTDNRADRKKAVELVEQELRLLGLIRDVITASGDALTFVYFDDKRQALLEIDQDYQKTKNTNPEQAQRVRDAQLTGLISGMDYRKLREVDRDLLDGYLAPAMREDTTLAPHADALLGATTAAPPAAPAGLDLLDDDPPSDGGAPGLSTLYTLLVRAGAEDTVQLPVPDGAAAVELPRKAVAASVAGTLLNAIENKQRDSRKLDDLAAPMVHLREAARSVDKAREAYVRVQGRAGFDHGAFRAARAEYERATAELLLLLRDDTSD